jgi:hypothetical protein
MHRKTAFSIPSSILPLRMLLLVLTTGLLSSACKPSGSEKRFYREVVISRPAPDAGHHSGDGHDHSGDSTLPEGHPPVASGMDPSALPPAMRGGAGVDLAWEAPAGWTETAGQGMRRASFSMDGSEVLCTIVTLGGSAGGTESNIRRWLGQVGLNLDAPAFASMMQSLESGSTASGLAWIWVDFNSLVQDAAAPSMVAAILEKDGSTVFVKMTGPAAELTKQDAALRALVKSIR